MDQPESTPQLRQPQSQYPQQDQAPHQQGQLGQTSCQVPYQQPAGYAMSQSPSQHPVTPPATKPQRAPIQWGMLALGIVMIVLACCSIYFFVDAYNTEMRLNGMHESGSSYLAVSIGYMFGLMFAAFSFPAIGSLTLFHRITPVRVIVNAVFAAPMLMLAFSMLGIAVSAIASSSIMGPLPVLESIEFLVFVVIPFVYTVCLVACGMRLRREQMARCRAHDPSPAA